MFRTSENPGLQNSVGFIFASGNTYFPFKIFLCCPTLEAVQMRGHNMYSRTSVARTLMAQDHGCFELLLESIGTKSHWRFGII